MPRVRVCVHARARPCTLGPRACAKPVPDGPLAPSPPPRSLAEYLPTRGGYITSHAGDVRYAIRFGEHFAHGMSKMPVHAPRKW